MDSKYVDDLIDDDEIPELTGDDLRQMMRFEQLPVAMQTFLTQVKTATIRPDAVPAEEVTLKLSQPVLARFRASGTGWESRVDAALLEWMEEHKAS